MPTPGGWVCLGITGLVILAMLFYVVVDCAWETDLTHGWSWTDRALAAVLTAAYLDLAMMAVAVGIGAGRGFG